MSTPPPPGVEPRPPLGLRVAMVVYGDVSFDSRVQREAVSLAEAGCEVVIHCLPAATDGSLDLGPGVTIAARMPHASAVVPRSPSPYRAAARASRVRRLRDQAAWLLGYARNVRAWGKEVIATAGPVDVWHAHDYAGLVAAASEVGGSAAFVYDVHDIFVETGSAARMPQIVRLAFRRHERRLACRADGLVTVNADLARVLVRRCKPASITVVHNCPPRWTPPEPRPDLLRRTAGIEPGAPVVLYHGVLARTRGLETLCDAMLEPPMRDVHVALMGFGELRDTLAAQAGEPRFGGRLHVLEPVPPAELLPWVASADAGVMVMPPATMNLYLSTPNKLFECLAAGTPVVVSDLPAVRRIVLDGDRGSLGATCRPSDPRELARAISSIVSLDAVARQELRERCASAARDRWNWEVEVEGLLRLYARLAHRTRSGAAR